jgi:hypothetical protein
MASLVGHSAWQQCPITRTGGIWPPGSPPRLVIGEKRHVENLVAQNRRFENLIAQITGASSPAELRLLPQLSPGVTNGKTMKWFHCA